MTIMKTCGNCKLDKKLTEFHKNCASKDGYTSQCKDCRSIKKKIYCESNKERIAARNKKWYYENQETILKKCKKYFAENREDIVARRRPYMKKWRKENREHLNIYDRSWRAANKESYDSYIKPYLKKWAGDNKDIVNARNSEHRANKINATPSWANKEAIKEIYREAQHITEETGELYHVDHIIPLKGKYICGLHCENNLQVIPAIENLSKSNKLELI